MITCLVTRRASATIAIAVLMGIGATRAGAQPVAFEFDAPIDLGSNLTRIGSLEWSQILGTEWDTGFQIGGIVGQNVRLALSGLPPRVHDVIAGLGGRPITRTSLRGLFERAVDDRLGREMTFLDLDHDVVARELARLGAG